MKERGDLIPLPLNPAPHLTDWLLEIGPASAAGMGEVPLSWETMDAWQRLTGIELDPWEARTLRRMSGAFLAERHAAEKPDRLSPMYAASKAIPDASQRIDAQFAAMMKAFARPRK